MTLFSIFPELKIAALHIADLTEPPSLRAIWPCGDESWSVWRGRKDMHHRNPVHFTHEETEAQRGKVIYSRSQREKALSQGWNLNLLALSTPCWFFFPIVENPGVLPGADISPGDTPQPAWVPNLSTDPYLQWSVSWNPFCFFQNFFQFLINTDNKLHMASMFTSLCEPCSSCTVYQFNMFKTDASSVTNSASLFSSIFYLSYS